MSTKLHFGVLPFFTVIFLFWGASQLTAAPRVTLSLDGIWTFATDPDGVGEKENWFATGKTLPKMPREGYAPNADGTIKVPGCWDAQGYGTETPKLKHNFIGKGWYKKTVFVPENWKNENVFLTLTGVARYAKVWINGISTGHEAIGCVSPHEWDVTKMIVSGKDNDITICVDSKQRYEIDTLVGCAQIIDYMDIEWGGLWGHVLLEARPQVRLGDYYIRTKYKDGTVRVETSVIGDTADSLKLEVFEYGSDKLVAQTTLKLSELSKDETSVAVETKVPDAKLWSPYDPNLYTARLTLLHENRALDTVQNRFGIREFQAVGSDLLLNGKKLMLHGYGDDHVYPHDWSYSANKDMYLRRLRMIKSFGFNYVRHHSTTMPPEYYEACDEIGIMPMVEFLIGYQHYMPGEPHWLKHVPEGTSPEPAIHTYLERWEAVVKQYRNHPSVLCWVLGNELWSEKPVLKTLRLECKRIAQEHDPDRFFLDSAGIWRDHISNPENDRDTVDLYCTLFDEWTSPILNTKKFDFANPLKPVISHESGNFITFTRPDEIELYDTSNFKPFWMIPGREKLKQLDLLHEANDWATASDKLYFLHHKYNVESLRKNPKLSGYQWWLLQDYWTTSNGLFDTNFRPKIISRDVQMFNAPTVALQDGLARTYRGGDEFQTNVIFSNYSPVPLREKLHWSLTANGEPIAEKHLDSIVVDQGAVSQVAVASGRLPTVEVPTKMVFSVTLDTVEKIEYTNQWDSWLFPEKIALKSNGVTIYVDEETKAFLPKDAQSWSLKSLPESEPYPADAVYLVSYPEPAVVDAMNRGAGVVLLGGLPGLKSMGIKYQSVWWKGGDSEESNHVGTYVYDNPIVREMAPDHWGNIAWAELLQGANKFYVENAPARPEVIVRALPSIVRVQDTPLIYRVGVGKGTLIGSGLNHRDTKDKPENAWLIAKMIEDAARFVPPEQRWPASFCAPKEEAPEGMLLGYRRAYTKHGEQTSWHSYRGANDRVFVCRQDSKDRLLEWDTVTVPKTLEGDNVTFIFAGALGYATEPKTEGFELLLDRKPVLKFDLPEPAKWTGDDGKTILEFRVKKEIGPDRFGLFTLQVPKSRLKPGQTARLGVRSLGENSRRWFGLNPFVDLKND